MDDVNIADRALNKLRGDAVEAGDVYVFDYTHN